MVNILETLNDITKAEDNGVLTDSLIFVEGQSPNYFKDDLLKGYYESEHEQRKKQLMLNDPVHNIVLKDYLQMQVGIYTYDLWLIFKPIFLLNYHILLRSV